VDAAGNESEQSSQACATTEDVTAPSVPAGLSAEAVSGSQINLDWNPSSGSPSSYRVYQVGTNNPIATVNAPATAYNVTGLNPETQYCFTVSAVDAAGNESEQSSQACATTEDVTAPSVPANLSAEAVSGSQINLDWNPSSGSPDRYRVYQEGVANPIATVNAPGTSYNVTGLNPETQYCFTVSAADAAGNESDRSSQACATTYDVTPPDVVIISPISPHSTTTSPITVTGSA
jgi:chitodextrinase